MMPTLPTLLTALSKLDQLVLEHLPAAPNGLSVHELADGLLDNAGPVARGEILAALRRLDAYLGGLVVTRGDDFLGHADVDLWGLPRDTHSVVARAFACAVPPSSPKNVYPCNGGIFSRRGWPGGRQ